MKQCKKKTFSVSDYSSIDACLEAMKQEGYMPVRRMEKPIFKETSNGPQPVEQDIVFEGKLIVE